MRLMHRCGGGVGGCSKQLKPGFGNGPARNVTLHRVTLKNVSIPLARYEVSSEEPHLRRRTHDSSAHLPVYQMKNYLETIKVKRI